MAQSSVVMGNL
jgi:hypothetical protein